MQKLKRIVQKAKGNEAKWDKNENGATLCASCLLVQHTVHTVKCIYIRIKVNLGKRYLFLNNDLNIQFISLLSLWVKCICIHSCHTDILSVSSYLFLLNFQWAWNFVSAFVSSSPSNINTHKWESAANAMK